MQSPNGDKELAIELAELTILEAANILRERAEAGDREALLKLKELHDEIQAAAASEGGNDAKP